MIRCDNCSTLFDQGADAGICPVCNQAMRYEFSFPMDAKDRRIRDLEREVQRLKGETVRQGDLIRALIDAAMAKDPQL